MRPTAAKSTPSAVSMSPTTMSLKGRTTGRKLTKPAPGIRASRSVIIAASSSVACATVTPWRSRPRISTSRRMPVRNASLGSMSARALSVVQISDPPGYSKSAGMTPATVKAWFCRYSVCPMALGEAANSRTHALCDSTTSRSAPRRSSSMVSARPIRGCTPATSKNPPITATVFAVIQTSPRRQSCSNAPL